MSNAQASTAQGSKRSSAKKPEAKQRSRPIATLFWLCITMVRGVAFFVATYVLLSLSAFTLGNTYNQNVWWIDLSLTPTIVGVILEVVLVFSLYAFVIRIPRRLVTRIFSALPSLLCGLYAFINTGTVYGIALSGRISLGFPVPFSLFIAITFLILAAAILFGSFLVPERRPRSRVATIVIMALSVVLIGVLFPIGQVLCFGTTEYRGNVDATVVLGAHVSLSGTPSPVLQDRLDKAIELFEEGRTRVLIMSGGIDALGTNEALAMRDYAIAHGVPASAILVDEYGNNTQLSAVNTIKMIKEAGFKSVSTVSNFYHLARIKMLYLANGLDVITVPAGSDKGGPPAPFTFLREIPGWWYYWFTNLLKSPAE
ncbi:MAG: YdcF family protein [Coriobacteriia bacterium]|nr:YdcF family protein [Coriobacteriia bacterium]